MSLKLEIIKNYNLSQKRDSWIALGENKIKNSSKIFNEGMIYKIDIPECPLFGFLIFCEKEFIENKNPLFQLDWVNFKAASYDANHNVGETTFGNNIVSPNFFFILTRDQLDELQSPFICEKNEDGSLKRTEMGELVYLINDFGEFIPNPKNKPNENFIPFLQENNLNATTPAAGDVIIEEKDYETCLKCLGYPFISEDELEYNREEILNLAIKPSLEEYFHWLPKVIIEEHPATGTIQEIPFPTAAYDVIHVSAQQRGTHGSGNITNTLLRFFDEASYGSFNYAGLSGTYRGTYRPHTLVSPVDNYVNNRALTQATVNLNTRVHFEKFTKEDGSKWIRVYSNKVGAFNIHWAIYSLNFNDVEFAQRQNLFKYCQAEIMLLFANLRRQAKSDIPGAIDYGGWITEANTMKQEVVTDWKALVKASGIMRGSL